MLDTASWVERFAIAALQHPDLSVQRLALSADPASVCIRNRFSTTLLETVHCSPDGTFVTSWGYRLGSIDSLEEAAARLAYLLAALPA